MDNKGRKTMFSLTPIAVNAVVVVVTTLFIVTNYLRGNNRAVVAMFCCLVFEIGSVFLTFTSTARAANEVISALTNSVEQCESNGHAKLH